MPVSSSQYFVITAKMWLPCCYGTSPLGHGQQDFGLGSRNFHPS